ncbi:MAG: hypothetical protein Q9209_007563 [Squamulea sp. 1 TL-2023]
MADQFRPASSIPRLSRLPVRSSVPSVQQPKTSIGNTRTANENELGQINIQKSRSRPTVSDLGRPWAPETKIYSKPSSSVAASQRSIPSEGVSPIEAYGESNDEGLHSHSSNEGTTKPITRGPRPSLSDRAIQTLSHVTPSPSPRRRQSGFFPCDSPAARPPSSLGRGRPVTSAGFHPPLPTSRHISPSKRPRLAKPSAAVPARQQALPARGIASTRSSQNKDASVLQTPSTNASINANLKPALKSSAALRETIANAKAARRAAPKYEGDEVAKPAKVNSSFEFAEIGVDDNVHINPLRKRIDSARSNGKLNISGMRLKIFPNEVFTMYDLDTTSDGPTWYESVDLVQLNAADNELEDLGWDGLGQSERGELRTTDIFAALQTLDLHGNRLLTLPFALHDLRHLTVLNLSRNRMQDPTRNILSIISNIESLRELNLADNQFSGSCSPLTGCRRLESLDIHSNAFTDLPEGFSACTLLRRLDVSSNRISRLPRLNLPNLTFFNLSQNQIAIDDLMRNLTAPQLSYLDLSACRIESLPPLRSEFQVLKTVIAPDNRISTIDVECIRGLEILDVKGNDLRSLPPELSLLGLKKLLVGGNPMRAPRRDIVEGTTERLMEWLKGRLPAGTEEDETF